MKTIFILFDSLNRRMLPPYGCDWVHAPNFKRLEGRAATFDNAYVGGMPCMPARRELHTGRHNFLHRSWGPIEPFDDSMPEILKRNGVYTHLVSDHAHYWEDGGCTYHTRYSSWEYSRGQEGDPWKGEVKDPPRIESLPRITDTVGRESIRRQDQINRKYMRWEHEQPQAKTFQRGIEFIRTNNAEDNWFLQIETFDPHEPFFTQRKYKDLYPHEYNGPHFDWPDYKPVEETSEQVQHCRYEYAALVSMCDAYLGKVLDVMDEFNLWDDTMLIVTSDHGFLLGEHGCWAKCVQPFYNEIARIPFFVWDPRARARGVRRESLIQLIDLAPTLLDFFAVAIPPDMQGHTLATTVSEDASVKHAVLFGIHGGHVNCTDGQYLYMRAPVTPENKPLYNYTLMPTHVRKLFSIEELHTAELSDCFAFSKGCRLLRIEATPWWNTDYYKFGSMLFDLEKDQEQQAPIHDDKLEARMIDQMVTLMIENDSPAEQFTRLGLQKAYARLNRQNRIR